MKKSTIYDLNKGEFDSLAKNLKEAGYGVHGFLGMNRYEINNNETKLSSKYIEFASIETAGSGPSLKTTLRTSDSDLTKVIDAHFSKKN